MRIMLNGEAQDAPDGATVETLVRALAAESRGVAVALDGEVVPRSEWSTAGVSAGQSVEVLTAVQGG